ncbi:MAG: ABC transporter substrate-binding protein, partial [Clostridia bacterium]|nr:ABC transporter substrate-binding protein [Clostridia bacterium]
MFEPSASAMEMAGEGYIVASVGEAAGEVPYTCFMMLESRLEKDPGFAEAEPEEIAVAIAPQFPDSDLALLTRVAARYREIGVWSEDPVMSRNAYENLLEIIREAGVIDRAPDFRDVVDNRFAEAALGK